MSALLLSPGASEPISLDSATNDALELQIPDAVQPKALTAHILMSLAL